MGYFEQILDQAYERSLTLNSGVTALEVTCWFKRNRAEFLALGTDLAIGSLIYAFVLANPVGIAALASAIAARKLTSEGYDYYTYNSAMKALKAHNQSAKMLTDIGMILDDMQARLEVISANAQTRLTNEGMSEEKQDALSYLASLCQRFDLKKFKSNILESNSYEDKLLWINYLEEKISAEKTRIVNNLENPLAIQATFRSKTKRNLTEALKHLTELSQSLEIYKKNLPNELPLNKLIEAKVTAIFSEDLTNPHELAHVFEQLDQLVVNLKDMLEKQKSELSVYTQSLLKLKKQIDDSAKQLIVDSSDDALINHFAYIFQYYSVYAELLETVILPYDASFYLTSLLQSKIESLKNPQVRERFDELMLKRQQNQLATPKLLQLRKWQFNSKNLPKIERAYLYLCEITGVPPIVGSDTGFWLSNIADPVVESLIRFAITVIAHHPEYTELLPLAVDAIQSGHFLNGGFEALSGIARLAVSQAAEHYFHHQREQQLTNESPQLLYHFTMNQFQALDLIYKHKKLNIRPLNEHVINQINQLLLVEKHNQSNVNLIIKLNALTNFIRIYMAKDIAIANQSDKYFKQHQQSIDKILEYIENLHADLSLNPKRYGGKKAVAAFSQLLNDLSLKYQSAKGIFEHFEKSDNEISLGTLKAQKRAELVANDSFQTTLTNGLLYNMGESYREQTVNHLLACRFYLWHVFNGNDITTENGSRTDKYKFQIAFNSIFAKLPQFHEAFMLLNSTIHQQVEASKVNAEHMLLKKEFPYELLLFSEASQSNSKDREHTC
ncbi:hypothetical protein L3V82_01130 [Thiotrichales bacterium 19S3-7]|nr:hypothetical protein [Thiotrichales bacterium 19S3-7]MCF6800764.1 hypothetical protein [Thiotrichales bacterium 19S3-11]